MLSYTITYTAISEVNTMLYYTIPDIFEVNTMLKLLEEYNYSHDI